MQIESIDRLLHVLEKRVDRLFPMSDAQINKIETYYGITLPICYKEFLAAMGNGNSSYMRGSSVFGNEIYHLKEWAEELLTQNNFYPLPDHSFVFWMHQGYQFAFFNIDEGEDPPIYYYSEGRKQKEFERIANHLSDFFLDQLSG